MRNSRYYDPPTEIRPTAGVKVKRTAYADNYTGTAEALIESGLITAAQLPGLPGKPKVNATFRPNGRKGWGAGCMTVSKNPGETFRVSVRVSDEEQERRESDEERRVSPLARQSRNGSSPSKRFTWADVNNKRIEPSGLVVENYQPRFSRYTGTAKQLSLAGVLPEDFPGFPKPEEGSKGWSSARWDAEHLTFHLTKRYVSGDANRREDATADYWEFDVFDNRYSFHDYLDRLGG